MQFYLLFCSELLHIWHIFLVFWVICPIIYSSCDDSETQPFYYRTSLQETGTESKSFIHGLHSPRKYNQGKPFSLPFVTHYRETKSATINIVDSLTLCTVQYLPGRRRSSLTQVTKFWSWLCLLSYSYVQRSHCCVCFSDQYFMWLYM